ncbi:Adaptive-response sensory-kinase SasA [subsurface metagenome]
MNKNFNIDARVILTLGRDSIKNHTTALVELVKNSYDADATKVWIDIFCRSSNKYIRIVDNGCGMTEGEIDKYWLRIGYSEKRTNRFSNKKRRKTGEKGIGRISSDRLGSILNLKTKSINSDIVGIAINWDDFDVEGKDLTSVPIKILDNPQISNLISKNSNFKTWTELEINNLRQNWIKNDIANLHNELSIFSPPFKKVIDFEIYLNNDIAEEYNGKIESPFFENAEIELNAEYYGKEIKYLVKDRFTNKSTEQKKITWDQLQQKFFGSKYEKTLEAPIFGPISLTLMFWTRESSSIFTENLRLGDLRFFLDQNAGVKIYRDNIRVKPYGNPKDPEGDWLGLAERKTREPAGVRRPRWVVSANQVVGAVFVSRDNNPNLTDSSSREGLIHGDAFNQLKTLVLGCLRILEIHRHEIYMKSETSEKKLSSPKEDVKVLNTKLNVLKKDLNILKKHISKSSHRPVQKTIDQVVNVLETIPETQKSINELVSQSTVFRGLATIGIASAVFGHETQTSISNFLSSTYTVKNILEKSEDKKKLALAEISKAIKYAKQVSSWGAFALARVQRDKRKKRKISITKILNTTLDEVKAVFEAIYIVFQTDFDEIECSTFAMDIEAIFLNLLTNAYTACQQKNRKRIINITLKKKEINKISGYSISISDTGPGINEEIKKMIWKPLFTTKVDRDGKEIGTGLGLTIIDSIVKELKGEKIVDNDPILKGARFYIWLPFN